MCMCAVCVCVCIRGAPASRGVPWLPKHGATRTTAASGGLGPALAPSVLAGRPQAYQPVPSLPACPKPTSPPQAYQPAPSLPACPKPSGLSQAFRPALSRQLPCPQLPCPQLLCHAGRHVLACEARRGEVVTAAASSARAGAPSEVPHHVPATRAPGEPTG